MCLPRDWEVGGGRGEGLQGKGGEQGGEQGGRGARRVAQRLGQLPRGQRMIAQRLGAILQDINVKTALQADYIKPERGSPAAEHSAQCP